MAKRGNNEGSIFRRKDGTWVAQISVTDPITGKTTRPSRKRRTQAEAVEALRELQAEASAGTTGIDRRMKLSAWLEVWLTDEIEARVETGDLAPLSAAAYRVSAGHVTEAIGPVKLNELTPTHVRQLHRTMLRKGLSATTVQRAHGCLRKALSDAERDGVVASNVAKKVSPPKAAEFEATVLTPEQSREMLDAVADHPWRVAFVLAATLGLRRGELAGLRWSDLDLDSDPPVLHVRVQMVRADGQLVESEPKSARSKRRLVVMPFVAEILNEHRRAQRLDRMAAVEWTDDDRVLTRLDGTGGTVEPYDLSKAWRKVRTELGLPNVRLHDLRHGFASAALSAGVPLVAVSRMLGHSTTQLTSDTYSHVLDDLETATADTLQNYWTQQKDAQ